MDRIFFDPPPKNDQNLQKKGENSQKMRFLGERPTHRNFWRCTSPPQGAEIWLASIVGSLLSSHPRNEHSNLLHYFVNWHFRWQNFNFKKTWRKLKFVVGRNVNKTSHSYRIWVEKEGNWRRTNEKYIVKLTKKMISLQRVID